MLMLNPALYLVVYRAMCLSLFFGVDFCVRNKFISRLVTAKPCANKHKSDCSSSFQGGGVSQRKHTCASVNYIFDMRVTQAGYDRSTVNSGCGPGFICCRLAV